MQAASQIILKSLRQIADLMYDRKQRAVRPVNIAQALIQHSNLRSKAGEILQVNITERQNMFSK